MDTHRNREKCSQGFAPFAEIARLAFATLAFLGAACSSSTSTPSADGGPAANATVKIAGSFVVLTHATTTLSATTTNGTDSGYTWTSSDATIASVAADGTVSGIKPGTVTITATGNTTKASSTYNVVVDEAVPYLADWLGSAHADTTALPFNHWNTPTPASIPTTCARCHSPQGFVDYLGGDGSARRSWSTSRRRSASVVELHDLPQPGRRRADPGDVPVGRDRHRARAARRAA